MNDELELKRALKELASRSPMEASVECEERLRQVLRARRRRVRLSWVSVAAAACLGIAGGWYLWQHKAEPVSKPAVNANAFVLLPYGQSDVPLESGVIMRVRVQSDAGPVDADLLVGQDGMARAVRFDQ